MSTKIIPVSDFRRHTREVLESAQEDGEAIVITQHGRPAVILLAFAAYEAILARLDKAPATKTTGPTPTPPPAGQGAAPLILDVAAGAAAARQRVNQEIVPQLGNGLGAGKPELALAGEQAHWRVPVRLSLPQLGDLGVVGVVAVDVRSGKIVADSPNLARLARHAERLYAGATLSPG